MQVNFESVGKFRLPRPNKKRRARASKVRHYVFNVKTDDVEVFLVSKKSKFSPK